MNIMNVKSNSEIADRLVNFAMTIADAQPLAPQLSLRLRGCATVCARRIDLMSKVRSQPENAVLHAQQASLRRDGDPVSAVQLSTGDVRGVEHCTIRGALHEDPPRYSMNVNKSTHIAISEGFPPESAGGTFEYSGLSPAWKR